MPPAPTRTQGEVLGHLPLGDPVGEQLGEVGSPGFPRRVQGFPVGPVALSLRCSGESSKPGWIIGSAWGDVRGRCRPRPPRRRD